MNLKKQTQKVTRLMTEGTNITNVMHKIVETHTRPDLSTFFHTSLAPYSRTETIHTYKGVVKFPMMRDITIFNSTH